MRIFFICKRYYTNKDLLRDRFGRLYHLPVGLSRLGADVLVTAIDYRNPSVEEINAEGVLFRTALAIPTKLIALPFHLYFSAQMMKPDIIIASGDSHIGYMAMHIAKKMRVRFVFDVYDYYPVFRGNRIPGMKTMFRLAVTAADLVLCAGTALQQRLVLLNPHPHTLLVENGVDRNLFVPNDILHARIKLGLDPALPIVGYFGSVTPTRGPLLIEACRLLRREIPALQLMLAGRVSDVAINEPWIIYQGEMPQAALPCLINACNIVTIPYANDPFNSMSSACKIAEYLACKKPVVATRIAGHEQIFKAAPSSLCEPIPEDIATAIQRQLKNPQVAPFPENLSWNYIARTLYKSLSAYVS